MNYTPRHAKPPRVPGSPVDPADIPPEPVGEIPDFVAVPSQARQIMRDAGLDTDVFDDALASARDDERLADALARCRRASDRVVEAACAWADGHPMASGIADDEEDRGGKDLDLLVAVREYEEVAP